MKKFKKSFSVILLIIILFYQHCITYANQTVLGQTKNIAKQQTSESTNYQNITNGGIFAEKDHFLYYFKNIGSEKCLPQLFRYDLEKNVEVGLSSDIFVQVRDMRVCNDGYVYFKGINIYDAPTSNYPLLYRIPIYRVYTLYSYLFMMFSNFILCRINAEIYLFYYEDPTSFVVYAIMFFFLVFICLFGFLNALRIEKLFPNDNFNAM